MKAFLRWCLDFLERKFPDKVVVRTADMEAFNKRLTAMEGELGKFQDKQEKIEMALNNINLAVGIVSPKPVQLTR